MVSRVCCEYKGISEFLELLLMSAWQKARKACSNLLPPLAVSSAATNGESCQYMDKQGKVPILPLPVTTKALITSSVHLPSPSHSSVLLINQSTIQ
eukprot:scaffold2193_cov179-Ochromonas_danica.AAC.3